MPTEISDPEVFLRMHAGQKTGSGAGMIAGAVAQRHAAVIHQTAEDQHIVLHRRERAPESWGIRTRGRSATGVQLRMSMPFGT